MNYFNMIRAAIAAIKAVEALMPNSAGKEKADAALILVEEVVGNIGDQMPFLLDFFTHVVDLFNKLGIFQKKTPV